MLDMAKWGTQDIDQLTWLTPPPSGALAQAKQLLHDLGALEAGKITPHGEQMVQLPCHPRIAHMLLNCRGSGPIRISCGSLLRYWKNEIPLAKKPEPTSMTELMRLEGTVRKVEVVEEWGG